MNLREYLFIKKMTIQEFSEIVDYSRIHISGIVNGKCRPSRKLAKRIEKETNGQVSIAELMQQSDKVKKIEEKVEASSKQEEKVADKNANFTPKGFPMHGSIFDDLDGY